MTICNFGTKSNIAKQNYWKNKTGMYPRSQVNRKWVKVASQKLLARDSRKKKKKKIGGWTGWTGWLESRCVMVGECYTREGRPKKYLSPRLLARSWVTDKRVWKKENRACTFDWLMACRPSACYIYSPLLLFFLIFLDIPRLLRDIFFILHSVYYRLRNISNVWRVYRTWWHVLFPFFSLFFFKWMCLLCRDS